jgi:deoxycytidylate deaminase
MAYEPHPFAIEHAVVAACASPCAKSKRGVAIVTADDPTRSYWMHSVAFNGPPRGIPCDGSAACAEHCGRRCVHAEMRALRGLSPYTIASLRSRGLLVELVHVKVVDGKLVGGGGPSCFTCSREILDCGIVDRVWLFERAPRLATPGPSPSAGPFAGPFRALPEQPQWRSYDAVSFHQITLRNNGIY